MDFGETVNTYKYMCMYMTAVYFFVFPLLYISVVTSHFIQAYYAIDDRTQLVPCASDYVNLRSVTLT